MVALIEGILVAVIWASSFVLIKMGLVYLGPLTLAGLRYFSAALILSPWIVKNRNEILALPRSMWLKLGLLGLCAYTIANGAFNLALRNIPATMMSFLMSLNPIIIFFAAMVWLKEYPTRRQVFGLCIALVGSGLFFWNGSAPESSRGITLALLGMVAFAIFGVLGREVARERQVNTLLLTMIPLAVGGICLLLIAIPIEGLPEMDARSWGIVLWLAIVNTALAYVLYNHALQELTALEMNVLLNINPLLTAVWAWLLLSEELSLVQGIGIAIAIAGIILVQQRRK